MEENRQICPCGSDLNYAECCGRYHSGAAAPVTAEALMRSRYSAYVTGDIDYLIGTTLPANRTGRLRSGYQSTHASLGWLGLTITGTWLGSEKDKVGKVGFRADYQQDGRRGVHRELSRFKRVAGKWYYVDGEIEDLPA